jgi:pyruvate,water dikinase
LDEVLQDRETNGNEISRGDTMTPRTYEAPGPGTWEQDSTHFPRPVTRYGFDVFREPFVRGFKEGSARYGLLFSHLEPASVNGFFYNRVTDVDPDDGPEVERRFGAATEALKSKLWRADLDLWDREFMPDSIQRNGALQSVALADLDTEGLLAHLAAVRENAGEMVWRHHKFTIPAIIPTGLYLSHALAWTGLDAGQVLAPLKGSSPVSLGAKDELARLAHVLSDAALGPKGFDGASAQDTIDRLKRWDDPVGEATRAYLGAIGLRLAGGYDIADPCAIELPDMILGTIWAVVDAHGADPVEESDAAARLVREAVPEQHRERFDELLGEARRMNRIRDERGIYNDNWGTGIARTAILEAGRRLVGSGRLQDAQNALDATFDELAAVLRGSEEPSRDALAERTDQRLNAPIEEVPHILGPEPTPPPPLDGLPPDCAQMMGALGATLGEVFGGPPQTMDATIKGRPVSPGVYTGTARIVGHPADCNRLVQGDVLVTASTSSAFNVVLPLLGAIVTDRGGQLSHAAIVAREYGIPAVVGTMKATDVIRDGARITVDGTAGTVEIV